MNGADFSLSVQTLGWVLLHSIWQGVVLAMVLKCALKLTKKFSANTRYLIACATLSLMLTLPLATVLSTNAGIFSNATIETGFQAGKSGKIKNASETQFQNDSGATEYQYNLWREQAEKQFLHWLVVVWLIGVLISSLKLLGIWTYTRSLKRSGKPPVLCELQETLRKLSDKLRVSKPVRLLESSLVKVPTVIGWMKPVILIPSCALTGLTPQQLELILAHELAHIRRHDYLVNLFQTVVETLLFYHPAVWWVSSRIRDERENACDDLAVRISGDEVIYARALIELERLRKAAPSLAMAADGGSLTNRIHRLIGVEMPHSKRPAGFWTVVFIGVFFVSVAFTKQNSALIKETVANQLSSNLSTANSESARGNASGVNPQISEENRRNKKPAKENPSVVSDSGVDSIAPESDGGEKRSDPDFAEPPEPPDFLPLPGTAVPGLPPEIPSPDENTAGSQINVKYQRENKPARQDETEDFIAEMASVGYTNLSVNQLVRLREAEVTAGYVRSLNAVGLTHLSVDELHRLGINEVTPAYIQSIKNAGYRELKPKEFALFAEHDITADYIEKIRDAGYGNLSVWQLIDFSVSDVTPEFIRAVRAAGFGNLPPKQMAHISLIGVTPEFIRKAQSKHGSLTIQQIIRLKEHGSVEKFDEEG